MANMLVHYLMCVLSFVIYRSIMRSRVLFQDDVIAEFLLIFSSFFL